VTSGRLVPILPAAGDPPPEASVAAALGALADGRIVGIPTDTVYGLAADPFRPGATERLFEAKRRSRDVDLPVLVASIDQAMSLTTAVPDVAAALMRRYWPGPLTLVLPRRPDLTADLGEDEATIGIRCPAHPVPLALCAKGGPIATTSANLHGEPTSQTAEEVVAVFGDAVAVVLDGGRRAGSPSTVVDCTGTEPRLLRKGRVAWSEVQAAAL
jgi:tRNA threonylcarbamoyl adenosine modification protein (Sua5/YciO/YrdC/YwlC family)